MPWFFTIAEGSVADPVVVMQESSRTSRWDSPARAVVNDASPTITIGLLWHSVSSDNFGIGAMTISHVAIIEEIAKDLGVEVRFIVIGWAEWRDPYFLRSNIEVVGLRGKDLIAPRGGLRTLAKSCDIVLDISTGDGFTDIYGPRRFVMAYVAKLNVLTSASRYILSPQTIGPFNRRWVRPLVRALLRRVVTIATRDGLTTQFLKQLGVTANVVEATDVAFRLPYRRPSQTDDGRTRVGLNVSGLLFNGGYTRDNMFSLRADYPALVRSIIAHFASIDECELHLIAHVISDIHAVEDDYRVAQALAKEFPGVVVAPRFEDPSAAKSYIATMDMFYGSRMHACIAAFSSGVPILPLAYSRKFAGLFGSLDYQLVADCTTQSQDEILATAIEAYERRVELRQQVSACLERAEQKLRVYESVLRSVLSEVAGHHPMTARTSRRFSTEPA